MRLLSQRQEHYIARSFFSVAAVLAGCACFVVSCVMATVVMNKY